MLTIVLRRSAKAERHDFGRFFYRFPTGESGLDVYNRVSSFIGTLIRDVDSNHRASDSLLDDSFRAMDLNGDGQISFEEFVAARHAQPVTVHDDCTIVLVTHGLTMRLFLMRWFQVDVETFEETANPPNCGMVVMDRCESGRFKLTTPSRKMLNWT
eukprot:TRINITY_DN1152_c0_g1_i1.p1 TRINITY_DN1152_c0_g1~~TRINITY_DN1152_c0_g1_i1.p1  ORF type:complete len:156 (+),score=46.24 TRINITY_DN1152_c0_g1_i1:447-914(+)